MVREYCREDADRLRYICTETAPENMKNTAKKRQFLLLRYCDFYIEKSPKSCFVAEKDGRAVGYVICCPDSVFFKKEFRKFLKAHGASFFQRLTCFGDALIYLPFKKEYPAHLHIDILPEAQRQGNGRALINALEQSLRKQGKCGVMLAVSKDNETAVKFYRALDFKVILSLPKTYLLGKKL